jgi:hypothetical protein
MSGEHAVAKSEIHAEMRDAGANSTYHFQVTFWIEALGMIEIILTVCAIANPANCEEKYLQFAWEGSLNQCMMAAQPYIAQWIGTHPQWIARKWTCEYPGNEKRKI